MNMKTLLLIMLCINIASIYVSYSCLSYEDSSCASTFEDSLINSFFKISTDKIGTTSDDPNGAVLIDGTIEMDGNYQEIVGDTLNPQSTASAGSTTGLAILLDGLKMVLGIFSFFTPLPFLDVIYSLGLPVFIYLPFTVVVLVLYTFGVAEFVRGAKA